MLVATVGWRRGELALEASHKVTGARYVDLANRWRLPRYATTDGYAEAGWDIGVGRWELRARMTVSNLFDVAHLAGTARTPAPAGVGPTHDFGAGGDRPCPYIRPIAG